MTAAAGTADRGRTGSLGGLAEACDQALVGSLSEADRVQGRESCRGRRRPFGPGGPGLRPAVAGRPSAVERLSGSDSISPSIR